MFPLSRTQRWRMLVVVMIIALLLGSALPAVAQEKSEFEQLRDYATAMQPLVEQAVAIAQEDAAILRSARGHPETLCSGELAANREALSGLREDMAAVSAPETVSDIHGRLLAAMDEYIAGGGKVLSYCESGDRVQALRGALMILSARARFGAAIIEFDLLLLQSGLEELAARYPGSDFEKLIDYAQTVGPDYQTWAELIAKAGPVIEEANNGHPEALCDADLAADAGTMQAVVTAFEAVDATESAENVHTLLLAGAKSWLQGLNYAGEYCATHRSLYFNLAKLGFDVGAAGFASATTAYVAALEQAWRDMWAGATQ